MHIHRITRRSIAARAIMMLGLVAAYAASATHAQAFIYTVGQSGVGNNCSFPTIQQALNAAAATPQDDEIWITRDTNDGSYQQQALVANIPGLIGTGGPGTLKIVGGFDNCLDIVPEGVTELHGAGGTLASVLFIRGHDVELEGLRLTRGDATTNSVPIGGGIYYQGTGSLHIRKSIIDNNDAQRGGGIAIEAVGGDAWLTLQDTQVSDNRATRVGGGVLLVSTGGRAVLTGFSNTGINRNYAAAGGGGIAMAPGSGLYLDSPDLQLDLNGTLGDGGALLTVPPAIVTVRGSPIAGADGTFTRNEAENGGAIAVGDNPHLGTASGEARMWLTSGYPDRPQSFAFNRAHGRGGMLSLSEGADHAVVDVCSWNIAIWGNTADTKGSISHLDGAGTSHRHEQACDTLRPACAGACNLIQANTGPASQPTGGSLYAVENGADLQLHNARLVQNTAGYLFRELQTGDGNAPSVELDNVLVAWNTGTSIVAQVGDDSTLQMRSTTVAGNALSAVAFANNGLAFISDSILDQPGNALFATDPMTTNGQLVNTLHNSAYAGEGATVWRGAPTYFNPAVMDYRLTSASLGIDMLPDDPDSTVDVYGRARTVDIWWRNDLFGQRDLGAIETQQSEDDASDLIFYGDFEAI